VPILQFAAKRAVEIADHGFTYHQPNYLRDPDPATFAQWIRDYTQYAVQDQQCYLAFDIETPHKQGKDEEEVAREDDDDYTILRCSFAYKAGEAVSVPWRAEYIPYIEELFAGVGTKLVWNANYDVPRITAQMPIHGDIYDGMLMWHVLNSALPKGLGFVSPFYSQDMPMWKHTSKEDPAGYNCQDSDALLRNVLGIKPDLEKNGLWKVFERHVVQLNRVLSYMSSKGVLRDEVMRQDAEVKLSALLDETEKQMDASVPQEARRLHPKNGYKKTPKDTTGLVSLRVRVPVRRCAVCGLESPKKSHFAVPKSSKKPPNPCGGAGIVEGVEEVERFAKALEFKVSKVGLEGYQRVLKHQAIINRHENRVTFDESAIEALMKKYPKDKLYPLILKNRSYSKLISTYVGETIDGVVRGGMPIGRDGHIHTSYSHNPSTLRLASQAPNLQNLPRTSNGIGDVVRNLIVASPGCILKELDFNAIEAVLVGFFACDPTYIRLSKLGIHSYLASHILGRPADLKWSDEDLAKYFLEIKKAKDDATKLVYNGAKRGIHLTGYGGTPHKMHQAEPEVFKTIKEAERLQGIYFELFPSIKKWQYSTRLQAEKDGYLRNPFSYIHRFYRVFRYTKVGKDWKKEPDAAGDGNKVLAFLPQSTAAGIIKEVMLRLYFDYFEEAGQYMRLQVHDSLVNEIPIDLQDQVTEIIYREMTRPVPELRLSASYGMGDALSIGVDIKSGYRWGEVH
jgi:DNA polymerase I-like protein with 3'-5' exonuclease and polymerase domains